VTPERGSVAEEPRPAAGASLSPRNVLGEMARAYRQRWDFLLSAGLLVFVPISLVEALEGPLEELETDDVDAITAVELGALAAAQSVTSLIATVLYAGIVAAAVAARREGGEPSLRGVARVLPYRRLIAADLLLVLVVALGLLLLLVPGAVFLTWFALVGPAIKVEHRGVVDGFRRSRALVRHHFWRVAALVVPAFFAEELVASGVESLAESTLGDTFVSAWLGGLVGNLMAAPIFALAVVVVFYELCERPARAAR
jgi:hypothetical protein